MEKSALKIWDLPVRICHWLLVVAFISAYITHWLGPSYFNYHVWCGYIVLVLMLFRIMWGLVGTYHARFTHFVRNPIVTAQYAVSLFKKTDAHYAGHNPLGAVMVVALILAMLIQAITGLFSNDEIFNLGPLYGFISNELSLQLTSLHRQLFYWILAAVVLHIMAVCFHVFLKRENIVKAMITGEKNAEGLENEKEITSSRIGLAAAIIIVLSLALIWLVQSAPET